MPCELRSRLVDNGLLAHPPAISGRPRQCVRVAVPYVSLRTTTPSTSLNASVELG